MSDQPYRIGLTGNIATGKSTVARMLSDLGAERIDADRVAHEMMAPGGPAYDAVIEDFGREVVADDGTIDRQALGAIVFNDAQALARLEADVHPPTIAEVNRRIARSDAPVVVVEAIKLLESGMAEHYNAIWVTMCSRDEQIERLMADRGLSRSEAERRVDVQPPPSEKIARADVVIDTSQTLDETRAQIRAAWDAIPR
jgi:dephospho-CoA kinase